MFFSVADWFPAFLLTLTVELPVCLLLLGRVEPGPRRLAGLVLFANLATHPIVWFVVTQLLLVGTPEYVLAAEGWAFGAEALFYLLALRGITVRRAAAASLAANLASFLIGRLVLAVLPEVLG